MRIEAMYLFDQRALGIAILFLLSMLVAIKRFATGSILDRPQGNLLVQVVNIFNLFFLLVVNPLTAILLIARRLTTIDPTHIYIDDTWTMVLEITGLAIYVIGFFLMAWALLALRHNYQLGGSAPRAADEMVVVGPYRFVRHPMYSAALGISLGLACLIQSLAVFVLFMIYLALIIALIPAEEAGLRQAYEARYMTYQRTTKKLVPFLY
jgi:protein-S-isoprenylcysteine O-methyltransferase Ste14